MNNENKKSVNQQINEYNRLNNEIKKLTNKSKMQAAAMWNNVGKKSLSGIKNFGVKTAQTMKYAIMGTVATAGVAMSTFAIQGLSLASNLEEVQNVADTTFGDLSKTIDKFAKTSMEKFGISELSAKKYSGTLGAMIKSSGISGDKMLIMSKNLTSLTGDMASFYNLDSETAFEKIRSGISGETEPLKQLGINMSVANLEAFRLAEGIGISYSKMSEADKTLLRYNYLMNVTKDSQEDFAKTSDSYANQLKILKQNYADLSMNVMSNLLPILSKSLKQLNNFMTSFDTSKLDGFITSLGDLATQLLPIALDLLPIFTDTMNFLLPLITGIAKTALPIFSNILKQLFTSLQPLIPLFLDLISQLLPPISDLIMMLIPPLANIIGTLLPPLTKVLTSVMTLLNPILKIAIDLIELAITPLAPLLEMLTPIINKIAESWKWLADIVSPFVDTITKFLGGAWEKVSGFFTGLFGGNKKNVSEDLPKYARGGFANRPSIFGEAGLEVAIPIKPGNNKSIELLEKTSMLLGLKNTYIPKIIDKNSSSSYNFVYSPNIYSNDNQIIKNDILDGYKQFKKMMDDIFNKRERRAYS